MLRLLRCLSVLGVPFLRGVRLFVVGQTFVDPVTNICGHAACGTSRRGAFVSTVAHAWALRSDLLAAVARLERVEQRRDGIARWFLHSLN